MDTKRRRESAYGFRTRRVRRLVERAYSRPAGDQSPGVVVWGAEVYEDGVLLGRVDEVSSCFGSDEQRVRYVPGVRAGGAV